MIELRLNDARLPLPYTIDPSMVNYQQAVATSGAWGAIANWLFAFVPTSHGALAAGDTITVAFTNLRSYTFPASPTVVIDQQSGTDCQGTASTTGATITVTLANLPGQTCTMPYGPIAAVELLGLTVGAVATGSQPVIGLSTSNDRTATYVPATQTAMINMQPPTDVHVSAYPQTADATSTWTWSFEEPPSYNGDGALVAGSTITVAFPSAFGLPAHPTVTLPSGSGCSATATTQGQIVTITLADAAGPGSCRDETQWLWYGDQIQTLSLGGITNPSTGTYAGSAFSVRTSSEGPTASSPASAVTIANVPMSLRRGCNAAAPGVCDDTSDSVDPGTGDFTKSSADVSVESYGPPLTFTRTYDSSLAQEQTTPGVLGYGWTDNWNVALTFQPAAGSVTVNEPTGAEVQFMTPVSGACPNGTTGPGITGTYCAPAYVTASLTYDSGSQTYTFITHPYESYTFNANGQLTSESGPGGAAVTVAYGTPTPGAGHCPSTASSCNTVTSASGRTLVIASNSHGQVTSVTDPLGNTWAYAYCSPPSSTCASGDLVSVIDPLNHVTSYTYDEGNSNASLVHDLLTITNPNGQTGGLDAGAHLANVYNTTGQVTSQTGAAGNQTTSDYSGQNLATGTGDTVVTDPDGNKIKYVYTTGALTSKIEGYGGSSPSTWSYGPDPTTDLDLSVTDPNSHRTSYTYDADGNTISVTDPLGRETTYSFNSFDEQTCATRLLGTSDCSALTPPAAISPGGTVSPPSSAPPAYVTFSAYDTVGNPVWSTTGDYAPGSSSATQSRTTYELYSGETASLGGHNDSCAATPPSSTLPCLTINPDGVVTQLGYDSSTGDLTSSSTPDGNPGGETATTTYSYNGDGQQRTVVAPDGNVSGANQADYTTTDIYTADGLLHTQTVGSGSAARETVYGYDADGNQNSIQDARGHTTTKLYDANDQLALVTDPDSQQTLSCYDGDGNVTETVPAAGVAANNLTASSCPSSYPAGYGDRLAADATTTSYDALGDKTVVTTPAPAGQSGSETTTNTYDAAGQLKSTTAPPASNDANAPNQVTSYTYDADGELLNKDQHGSPDAVTSYCYDPDGDKTATVAPDGNSSGVATCSSSAPYQTSSPFQTGYTFDSLGEQLSKTPPSTSAVTNPTTSYSYDPAGNMLASQDPAGVTTTDTYTPRNQLGSVSYSDSTPAATYVYDANGNKVSMSDGTGSSTYAYDPFNELQDYTNGAGKHVGYGYDQDGNLTTLTYPLGAAATWATGDTVSYGYDNADELNSISDFNGTTSSLTSTPDGLPHVLSLGTTGDTISTTYDATDSPSDITLANGSTTLQDFAYTDTPSGTINSETDTPSSPSTPAGYDYNALGRVTQMTPGSAGASNYGYDPSGNLTTLPTGATGSYDNASELTSSTQSAATTNYTYNKDGERTAETAGGSNTVTATYSGAQELTSYSDSAANMTAATYDGDGLRQSATTTPAGGSSTTENFTWDPSSSLPRLLMDSNNAYIYGPGGTPFEQVNLSTGTAQYLVADQLGSVRAVVDNTGALQSTTSYDAWGNPQTTSGLSTYTPIGYAGYYTDPTGLTYNLARYYDPTTGQFFTVDPKFETTLQAYEYANDDPIVNADPSGQNMTRSYATGSGCTVFPGSLRRRTFSGHFSFVALKFLVCSANYSFLANVRSTSNEVNQEGFGLAQQLKVDVWIHRTQIGGGAPTFITDWSANSPNVRPRLRFDWTTLVLADDWKGDYSSLNNYLSWLTGEGGAR
jgi:RHS repeat-associated protein